MIYDSEIESRIKRITQALDAELDLNVDIENIRPDLKCQNGDIDDDDAQTYISAGTPDVSFDIEAELPNTKKNAKQFQKLKGQQMEKQISRMQNQFNELKESYSEKLIALEESKHKNFQLSKKIEKLSNEKQKLFEDDLKLQKIVESLRKENENLSNNLSKSESANKVIL